MVRVKWVVGNGTERFWVGVPANTLAVIRVASDEAVSGPFVSAYHGEDEAMPIPELYNKPVLVPTEEEVPF